MSTQHPRPIHQPLHPSVRPLLDPEYVAFHDAHMQYVVPDDRKTWDGSARTDESLPPGGSPLTPVGRTEDFFDLGSFAIRAFVPEGEPDDDGHEVGWPALLWFHGGGWAIGGIGHGSDFLTFLCRSK